MLLPCAMSRKNKIHAEHEPQVLDRSVLVSSACEGCADVPACVSRRASVPASAPYRPILRHARALPPWQTNLLHVLPQIALPNPFHDVLPAVYGMIPVATALRYVAEE